MTDAPRPIRKVLDDIWAEFRRARYEDDQEIVEYIAYLLLERYKAHPERYPPVNPINPDLVIAPSTIRYRVDEAAVERLVDEAEEIYTRKGGLGAFFDEAVLFYSLKWREKDSYPVPRHIVDFMLELLRISPRQSFADFSCGTGGFLVHRLPSYKTIQDPGLFVGVEPSRDLARLAHANMLLDRKSVV